MDNIADSDAWSNLSADPVYPETREPMLLSMPQPGAYIVVRIDPLGTLEALDDPETTEATSRMQTQRYIGYVEEALNPFDDDHPFRAVRVRLLHRGLPKESEANGVKPYMCFAVRPTTTHPLSIWPLTPSKPLPWTDCYHHTLLPSVIFRVRYSRAYDHESWWLKPGEIARFDDINWVHMRKRDALRKTYRLAHADHLEPSAQMPDAEESETAGPHDDSSSHHSDDTDASSEDNDYPMDTARDIVGFLGMMDEMAKEGRPHETMTLATVSYDLTSVTEWGAPEDFFAEQEQLVHLERQHHERAVARAKQADEETYGGSAAQTQDTYTGRRKKSLPARLSKVVPSFRKKARRAFGALRILIKRTTSRVLHSQALFK